MQERGHIKGNVLEAAMQKYFGRRAGERSRDEDEVETLLPRATDELHIGEGNEFAGQSGDKRGAYVGTLSGEGVGSEERHGVHKAQLGRGGDIGQEQGKDRKRRRVSRTMG